MRSTRDIEAIGTALDWKEFEAMVESAFSSCSFQTTRNVRLRKPPAEIDLVASRNRLAFAVDCKRWKRTVGRASMLRVSKRQIIRAKRLLAEGNHDKIIPIIVTLHDECLRILENGVPVVPIHSISNFILDWENARNEITILSNEEGSTRQIRLR